MKTSKQNPYFIDKEDQELFEAFEHGESEVAEDANEILAFAKQAAANFLEKNKNINIRLSEHDIQKLKSKAAEKGLPYQTLVASILHQYVNDKIREKV